MPVSLRSAFAAPRDALRAAAALLRDHAWALREGWRAYREALGYCRFCDQQAEEHYAWEDARPKASETRGTVH